MQPLNTLVIIGHGLWLEMTIALLSQQLRQTGIRITAIVQPALTPEPDSFCSGPELLASCELLELPLAMLLSSAQGNVTLGCQYRSGVRQWFVPFGHYGLQPDASEFEQAVLSQCSADPHAAGFKFGDQHAMRFDGINPLNIAAMAAMQRKFALAPANRPDLQQALQFGLQLDSKAFTACLQQKNRLAGVEYRQSQQLQLLTDITGTLQQIQLDDGTLLAADFCVDCRPPPSPTCDHSQQSTGKRFRCWAKDEGSQFNPDQATRIAPHHSSWQTTDGWLVQHQLQLSNHWHTLIHCPEGDPTAQLARLSDLYRPILGSAPLWQWCEAPAYLGTTEPWQHNVLHCGVAVAALEHPLFSGVSALQFLLHCWLELLPATTNSPASAKMFNLHWQQYQAEVLAYLHCHEQPLATKQGRLFSRLGRLSPAETSAIRPAQWFGLMVGMGLRPDLPSMLLANRTAATIGAGLQQVQQSIDKLVSAMPGYADTLQRLRQSR